MATPPPLLATPASATGQTAGRLHSLASLRTLFGEHFLQRVEDFCGRGSGEASEPLHETRTVDRAQQGRVFLITLPKAGSSPTRWTSPRANAARATATASPSRQSTSVSRRRGADPRLGRAWPSPRRPNPPVVPVRRGRPTDHARPGVQHRPKPTTPLQPRRFMIRRRRLQAVLGRLPRAMFPVIGTAATVGDGHDENTGFLNPTNDAEWKSS